MEREIWKDIQGFEGLYQVSNCGNVKSLNYRCLGKEKVLIPRKNTCGYLFVGLWKKRKEHIYTIHRLVMMTFRPVENMEQLEVDHIDTNIDNNNLENLRWATRKENLNNPLSKVHSFIPIVQLGIDGHLVNVYDSLSEVAQESGFFASGICNNCKGKLKTYKGYKWMYLKDYIANISPYIKTINLFGKTYEVNN